MKTKFPIKSMLFLLFCSCTFTTQIHNLPEGGVRPKNPRFKLARNPYTLTDAQLIDTTAIYLAEIWDRKTGEKAIYSEPHFVFYRFFANGRVYHSCSLDHFPSVKDLNNFSKGMIGFYKIEKNNKINIEFFEPINSGQYILDFGFVKADSIFLIKRKWNNSKWTFLKNKIDIRLCKVKDHRVVLYSHPNW